VTVFLRRRPTPSSESLLNATPPEAPLDLSTTSIREATDVDVEDDRDPQITPLQNSLFALCKDCGIPHKAGSPHHVVFKNKALRKLTARDPKYITTQTLPNGLTLHYSNHRFNHVSVATISADGKVTTTCGTSAGQIRNQLKNSPILVK